MLLCLKLAPTRSHTPRRHGLPQGDPAVIRWNSLMPIRSEPTFTEALEGLLEQRAVLETASRQHHALFADGSGDS